MNRSVLIIIALFAIVIIANLEPLKQNLSPFINTLANIAAAGGLIAVFLQFKRERDINEADFIIRINHNFMTNDSISRIYKMLEESKVKGQQKNPFTQQDIIDMANYLTYFDPFYSLIKRNVIKIETIDTALAYRFFLAANNRFMQEMLLCKESKEQAWEAIYLLYEIWMKYRDKKDKSTWQPDHALSGTAAYSKIIKKSD